MRPANFLRPHLILPLLLVGLAPAPGAAQQLDAAERAEALSSVRSFASCLGRHHAQMSRLLGLIEQSERQRETARDQRARRDAERAIEALIARAATLRSEARGCIEEADLPGPGRAVVVREPPPDPSAEHVAQRGGTVRTVEENAALADAIRVVRAEQVDGSGRLDSAAVRSAVRRLTPRLERCYERYLDRGTIAAHRLNLVFTAARRGAARGVTVERSTFDDASFDRCVRGAARGLRFADAPDGGDATFSYTLEFGRAPN